MTNACRLCDQSITQTSSGITCSDCSGWFHGKCVLPKTTKNEADISEDTQNWKCSKCSSLKKPARPTVAVVSSNGPLKPNGFKKKPPNVHDIYGMFLELKKDLNKFQSGLLDSIKKLQLKIEENSEIFDEQNKKMAQCFEMIDGLKKENEDLKRDIETIKRKQTEADQRARLSDLEIRGVPDQPNENVIGIVQSLAMALGSLLLIDENCIVFCYRAQPKEEGSPGTIYVRFNHQAYKDDLFRRRRSVRGFNSHLMRLPITSDSSVFVNESLCPERRVLFKKTNEIRKEKNYRYIWTREGKILVRKTQTSPAIVINCLADLNKL